MPLYVAVGVLVNAPDDVRFEIAASETEVAAQQAMALWLAEGRCHVAVIETLDVAFSTYSATQESCGRQAIAQAKSRLEILFTQAVQEGRVVPPGQKKGQFSRIRSVSKVNRKK